MKKWRFLEFFKWLLFSMAIMPICVSFSQTGATSVDLSDGSLTSAGAAPLPNILFVFSNESVSHQILSYQDQETYTDEKGNVCRGAGSAPISYVVPAICFFPETEYFGYFDSKKCYTTSGQSPFLQFIPSRIPFSDGRPALCNNTGLIKNEWSGNFLNWNFSTPMDILRKFLFGGTRYEGLPSTRGKWLSVSWAVGILSYGDLVRDWLGIAPAVNASGSPTGVSQLWDNPFVSSSFSFDGSFGFRDLAYYQLKRLFYAQRAGAASSTPSEWALRQFPAAVDKTVALVLVCDESVGLEENCKKGINGRNYPEGFFQKFSDKFRWGSAGYWGYEDLPFPSRVLYSTLRPIGPAIPPGGIRDTNGKLIKSSRPNPFAEWDEKTREFILPPKDAVTDLFPYTYNVFFLGNQNFLASLDAPSELFYEALRYYRGEKEPTPEFISSYKSGVYRKSTYGDGMQAVEHWDDPIIAACQKNFTIFMGDAAVNENGLLPGFTNPSSGSQIRADVANVDVPLWVEEIAAQEGSSAPPPYTGRTGLVQHRSNAYRTDPATFGIAGLAYWSHVHDIRPDLPGDQVVTHFFFDVRQPDSPRTKNQYWFAAKYGGFVDKNGNGKPDEGEWDSNGDGDPDNYFNASRPEKLISGLEKILEERILASNPEGSMSRASFNSSSIDEGAVTFQTLYDPNNWSGQIKVSRVKTNKGDDYPEATPVADWLFLDRQVATNGWDVSRRIFTSRPSVSGLLGFLTGAASLQGVPFRLSRLSSNQKAALGDDSNTQEMAWRWLRGDLSVTNVDLSANHKPQAYRARTVILGDIVNASPVVSKLGGLDLKNAFNPGYDEFVKAKQKHKQVLFVPANDGMVHAFDASDIKSGGGRELWAYIPYALYEGPSQPSTPEVDGLRALTLAQYKHHFYIDATPVLWDVDFAQTVALGGSLNKNANPDWHSILVGGFGKGGRALYAIDVTNADTVSSEEEAARQFLWEFSDPDLGFTYGRPIIAKTARYGWVVMVSSGYDNTLNRTKSSETVSGRQLVQSGTGGAFLFVLNAKTGRLLEKISLSAGSRTQQAGFAEIRGFMPNIEEGVVTEVYGGDLLGNLWRVDTSAGSHAFSNVSIPYARLESNGAGQPVTTRPVIIVEPVSLKRYIFVGTGRYLADADINNTATQTMYAIRDGSRDLRWDAKAEDGISSPLPNGVTLPVRRPLMEKVDDLTKGGSVPTNPSTPMGWYHDLPGQGERVSLDFSGERDFVSWNTTLPSQTSGDGCSSSFPKTRTYAVRLDASGAAGKSVLLGGNNVLIPYIEGSATGSQMFSVNGAPRLFISQTQGGLVPVRTQGGGGGRVRGANVRTFSSP